MPLTSVAIVMGVMFVATGAFSMIASIAGWNWFFSSAGVRMLIRWMSRSAARWLYFVLGVLIMAMGIHVIVNA